MLRGYWLKEVGETVTDVASRRHKYALCKGEQPVHLHARHGRVVHTELRVGSEVCGLLSRRRFAEIDVLVPARDIILDPLFSRSKSIAR